MSRIVELEEDDLRITAILGCGDFNNNAYICTDTAQKHAVLIDLPAVDAEFLHALQSVVTLDAILVTHWHHDHWAGYDNVRSHTPAPVLVGEHEININEERIDRRLSDKEVVQFGSGRITALHTPGHTPGHLSFLLGSTCFTGDALFAGGPGHTNTPDELTTLLATIRTTFLAMPDATTIRPGHGEPGTISETRRGMKALDSAPVRYRYGDIVWPSS